MVGSTIVDKGFVSTSSLDKGGFVLKAPIKYHIQTPAGSGIGAFIKGISKHKNENEFVFNSGSAFQITGVYQDAKKKTHVNLLYLGRTE